MTERVDARDVLDVNAQTSRAFRAKVIGYFERTGPDSWNDYEFVREAEGEIEVLPGIDVQLEPSGALMRMRSEGRVIRVAWLPEEETAAEIEAEGAGAARRLFMRSCLRPQRDDQGIGAAAVIVRKLGEE
jgi:hypothetical protein